MVPCKAASSARRHAGTYERPALCEEKEGIGREACVQRSCDGGHLQGLQKCCGTMRLWRSNRKGVEEAVRTKGIAL